MNTNVVYHYHILPKTKKSLRGSSFVAGVIFSLMVYSIYTQSAKIDALKKELKSQKGE